jgi:dTDP-4-dehydrorhamnose reductase
MRALVLGAAGLLGQDLCAALVARGHDALGCSRGEADITKDDAVTAAIARSGATHVFNCAAYTQVDKAEEESDLAFAINAEGAGRAAAEAARAGLPYFQLSTDYVFDGTKEGGYSEDDAPAPISAYGRSKAAGEQAALAAHPGACIVRTQWLYGFGGSNFVETMLRLGSERDALSVVDDQIGSPTWAHDLAAALVLLAESGGQGTYHLTNSETVSWFGFAQAIFSLAGLDVSLSPIPTTAFLRPAARPLRGVLRNQLWQAEGRTALRPWKDALASYLAARKEDS